MGTERLVECAVCKREVSVDSMVFSIILSVSEASKPAVLYSRGLNVDACNVCTLQLLQQAADDMVNKVRGDKQ